MSIYNSLIFTEALETVDKILQTTDVDLMSDLIEEIAENKDLTLACLMLLVMKLKGVDTSQFDGVDLGHSKPTIESLILPPGTRR